MKYEGFPTLDHPHPADGDQRVDDLRQAFFSTGRGPGSAQRWRLRSAVRDALALGAPLDMRGIVQPGAVEVVRLGGDQDFQRGQRMALAGGLIARERRAVEFSDLVPFDEAEEGAGLELEATEFHNLSILVINILCLASSSPSLLPKLGSNPSVHLATGLVRMLTPAIKYRAPIGLATCIWRPYLQYQQVMKHSDCP